MAFQWKPVVSRATWVFLMKYKSEVKHHLIHFFNWVRGQFNTNVKCLRTDGGLEFRHHELLAYYSEFGMEFQKSCVGTPQQNGVVERKHRHLLEVARALRFQARLPIEFWGDCALTAAYLINRMPLKVIGNKTPYEVLFGRKPTYDHLRSFGCLCYVHQQTRDKFAPRSRPGIFLGYPKGQKGYLVFDIESRVTVTSRDVQFWENIFPGDQCMSTGDTNPPPMSPPEHPYIFDTSTTPPVIEHDPVESHVVAPTQEMPVPSKRVCTISKRLSGYDYTLPPSIAPPSSLSHPTPPSASSTVHPLTQTISYNQLSTAHSTFLAAISATDEPKYFHHAVKHEHWRDGMRKEISALEGNQTWSLTTLPLGKRAIDSKWVYKVKYRPDGSIERYKARLVAKGYTQVEGVDFTDTFAPVAKMVTVCCLLTIAAARGWPLFQLDVNNAFLHGDLEEEVYMKIPQGFSRQGENRVCRLHKSLYGLKQASRNWYHKFTESIMTLGYQPSAADHSLFTFTTPGSFVAVLIYVDDVIVTGTDIPRIKQIME